MVGDELVEVGRHGGRLVRAIGRLAGGGAVAALVRPEKPDSNEVATSEFGELEACFGNPVHALLYSVVECPDRPLRCRSVDPSVPLP